MGNCTSLKLSAHLTTHPAMPVLSRGVGRLAGLPRRKSLPHHLKLVKIEKRIDQLEKLLNGDTVHDAIISMKIRIFQDELNELDPARATYLAAEARKHDKSNSSWIMFGVIKFVKLKRSGTDADSGWSLELVNVDASELVRWWLSPDHDDEGNEVYYDGRKVSCSFIKTKGASESCGWCVGNRGGFE